MDKARAERSKIRRWRRRETKGAQERDTMSLERSKARRGQKGPRRGEGRERGPKQSRGRCAAAPLRRCTAAPLRRCAAAPLEGGSRAGQRPRQPSMVGRQPCTGRPYGQPYMGQTIRQPWSATNQVRGDHTGRSKAAPTMYGRPPAVYGETDPSADPSRLSPSHPRLPIILALAPVY